MIFRDFPETDLRGYFLLSFCFYLIDTIPGTIARIVFKNGGERGI